VILPLRLFWSPAGRVWDLDKPEIAQAMYENVLQEAVREEELTTWLNGELLTPLHVNALTVSRLAKAPAVRDCPASLGR
jgi:hypothetical protein